MEEKLIAQRQYKWEEEGNNEVKEMQLHPTDLGLVPFKAQMDAIRTPEDFFDLFKNWEQKQILPVELDSLKYELVGGPHNLVIQKDEHGNMTERIIRDNSEAANTQIAQYEHDTTIYQNERDYMKGEDTQADIREEWREKLLDIINAQNIYNEDQYMIKYLGDVKKALSKGKPQPEYNLSAFKGDVPGSEDVTQAMKEFQEMFGESVHDTRNKIEVTHDVHYSQMPDGSVRKDMQLLDDIMIQKIEAHLRGIELVSLDFGVDAEYDKIRLGEETIQFDMENYE